MTPALDHALASNPEDPAFASVRDVVMGKAAAHALADTDALIHAYEAFIPELEQRLWADGCDPALLERYQAAHRQMEQLMAGKESDDPRHKVVVVVSVADRPQLLKNCLDSLLRLCEFFQYGGLRNGRYPKVAVLVADDSRDEGCMVRHRELARTCAEQGIETHYYGSREQLQSLDALTAEQRERLKGVLGDTPREAFWHKGASVMRNISYLKLRELWCNKGEPVLFHFIDSDQEFRVKAATRAGERDLYAISYFHALDRLFSSSDVVVATGKVVGDPPVSPSVMASGFLDDVIAFMLRMAQVGSKAACRFHGMGGAHDDAGAIYHDMRELFGFSADQESFDYPCTISGAHSNGDCLEHFAAGLSRFFYGEHPTRKTRYGYAGPSLGVAPARTVYSGNYVVKPEGLRHFLPFAPLRLRMPGPTLGRLLKAELGPRFVAANFPMLHQRTVGSGGEAEFRPGVNNLSDRIDISGEFVRQFYGDVMLFSMETLTAMDYPHNPFAEAAILEVLDATRATLLSSYNQRQQTIARKLEELRRCFEDPHAWWNRPDSGASPAIQRIEEFIGDVAHNFGSTSAAYTMINDAHQWQQRRAELTAAIAAYGEDREAWNELLFGNGCE